MMPSLAFRDSSIENAHRMGGEMDHKWLAPYTVRRGYTGKFEVIKKLIHVAAACTINWLTLLICH